MARTLRILHVAPGEPFGGLQRVVLNLSAEQSGGHAAGIIWTGNAERSMRQSDPKVVSFRAEGTIQRRILATRAAIREFAPDVVHVHSGPSWLWLSLLGLDVPNCLHIHGPAGAGRGPMSFSARMLERRLIARSAVLIAISEWIEKEWSAQFPRARFECVPNGIASGSALATTRVLGSTDRPVIGFASRLAYMKGVDEFADFVLSMHKQNPDAFFKVAGEGPDRAILESKLGSLINIGVVKLLGHVDDMAAFWSSLDLAIFTAPAEPFGLRLIEPVAHGVPVIAYETGAGSDEVARNCRGVTMVPYDDARAMADCAARLLADPDVRQKMGRDGRSDIDARFSMAAMSRNIEAIYRRILAVG